MAKSGFKMTRMFFDRKAVMDPVARAEKRAMSKFGAFVRRDARSSIRRRKRASRPGQAPTNRTGLLKKFIWFAYNASVGSVVIGPSAISGGTGAPAILEYGGQLAAQKQLKVQFGIGDYGPISIGAEAAGSGRACMVQAGSVKVPVVSARLRTGRQVGRARRLQQELNRLRAKKRPKILPRPYMGPAFEKNKPKAAGLWANSVRS